LLAKGRVELACSAGAQMLELSTETYWRKLQIFCQLFVGQNAAADLGLALLREQGDDDKAFAWAVAALRSDTPPPADLIKGDGIDPLVLATLRKNGRLLPAAALKAGDPNTLLFAAQIASASSPPPAAPEPRPAPVKGKHAKKAPPAPKPETIDELRLTAIERAVDAGVADPATLREAYAGLDLGAVDEDASDKIAIGTARQRAATYQLAAAQTVDGSKAEVIARVLDLTRFKNDGPGMVSTALTYAPMVAGIAPSVDLMWFSSTAVRVLMAYDSVTQRAGETGATRAWLDLIDAPAPAFNEGAKAAARVWPYRRLTQRGGGVIGDVDAWQATLPTEPPGTAMSLRATMLELLNAVGEGVTAADWSPVMTAMADETADTSAMPSVMMWSALSAAAKERRLGEAVALALRLLSADDGAPSPMAAGKAVESLTTVGRTDDARAIALQLALERGI
jgi:hypothetical protein